MRTVTLDGSGGLSFPQALLAGAGPNAQLLVPQSWPRWSPEAIDNLLALAFRERCTRLAAMLVDDFPDIAAITHKALDFPVPLIPVQDNLGILELFHGPSAAFKDFGARFLAGCLQALQARGETSGKEIVVLVATSGDTGGAVAAAFHGLSGVRVVVLYPKGRVSPLQEKQLVGFGGNVVAASVSGTFDDCQRLVKQALADEVLTHNVQLTTANSINIGRLIPQVFYYFEALARAREHAGQRPIALCVPCGNFGNLTAGIMAQNLGLPITHFIAATNSNDTVPRFLSSGHYEPRETIPTMSNAMDVSAPSNWPRIMHAFGENLAELRTSITALSVSEDDTAATIRGNHARGHTLCPHTAVAVHAASQWLEDQDSYVVALATAHPAKFGELVTKQTGSAPPLPPALTWTETAADYGTDLEANYAAVRDLVTGA